MVKQTPSVVSIEQVFESNRHEETYGIISTKDQVHDTNKERRPWSNAQNQNSKEHNVKIYTKLESLTKNTEKPYFPPLHDVSFP